MNPNECGERTYQRWRGARALGVKFYFGSSLWPGGWAMSQLHIINAKCSSRPTQICTYIHMNPNECGERTYQRWRGARALGVKFYFGSSLWPGGWAMSQLHIINAKCSSRPTQICTYIHMNPNECGERTYQRWRGARSQVPVLMCKVWCLLWCGTVGKSGLYSQDPSNWGLYARALLWSKIFMNFVRFFSRLFWPIFWKVFSLKMWCPNRDISGVDFTPGVFQIGKFPEFFFRSVL